MNNNNYWKEYRIRNADLIKSKQQKFREFNPNKIAFQNAKANAKKRNLPCDLTLEDIIVPEFCPVLGIKLIPARGIKTDNSPSVDRLIPSKGYIRGNIAVISLKANQLKSNGTIAEHEKVLQWMKENGCE